MAVTEVFRPLLVVPAYNDIEFYAQSDQYAVPDFKFYITIDIPSVSAQFVLTPTGSLGQIRFNICDIVKKYVNNYYPFAAYGWQLTAGGIIDVTVNIGEYYSGAVHTGSDYDFAIFNASLNRAERAVYLPANYQVAAGRNNAWLNNLKDGDSATARTSCKSDQDMVFYFLQTGAMQITDIEINTYDSAGSLLGISGITNPYAVTFPAVNNARYVCVNVGPNGLSNIDAGDVTGTFPIITPSVASIYIRFIGRTVALGAETFFDRYIDIDDCAPKYDKVTLHYLDRYGAFDFVHLYGNHQRTLRTNKTFYKGMNSYFEGSYEYVGVGDQTVPSPLSLSQKVLSSTYECNQLLRSDWLDDFQLEALQDLITSPMVHTQAGEEYKKYQVTDNTYRFRNVGDKLQRLDVNLSEGTTERRQYE